MIWYRKGLFLILLAGALAFLLLGLRGVEAQGLSIGVPKFDGDADFLSASSPAALLLRRATCQPLIERGAHGVPRPVVADVMQVDPAFTRWSFRLRSGVQFSNAAAVSGDDITYSLTRCAQNSTALNSIKKVSKREVRLQSELRELWIDIEAAVSEDERRDFPYRLADCPIIEKQSAEIFGADLGRGVNFLASGRFVPTLFKRGREVELRRYGSTPEDRDSASTLTIRSVEGESQIISALRLGTLDAYLGAPELVPGIPNGEETLVRLECGKFTMLKRRGLSITCVPEIELSNLRYIFN